MNFGEQASHFKWTDMLTKHCVELELQQSRSFGGMPLKP
jgi:hypothetical protein